MSEAGPGTQPLTLANELRARGHHVSFATSGGVMVEKVIAAGYEVTLIPTLAFDKRSPIAILKTILALGALIRREKIDVTHGHNGAATLCAWFGGLLRGKRVAAVTSIRGIEERPGYGYRNLIWRMLPGYLFAVCENGRKRLQEFGVRRDRVVITYNGVDLKRFSPELYDRDVLRRELGLNNTITIGTVGVMVGEPDWGGPGKGQHLLIEAASRLIPEFPGVRVMLVGDGEMRAVAEQTAARLGISDKVLFLGRRLDVPPLVAAMDIYCLPSIRGEFFPNSIVEAMAMAKPWVGSDIAGLSELTANGEAGKVVPIGDVDGLTRELRRLVESEELRARMGACARREVLERFAIERVVDRVLDGYVRAGSPV
jgi:glycosyltransferase involved in cell wall biosynthesis